MAGFDFFCLEEIHQEEAEAVVAQATDDTNTGAQPGEADRHVRARTAQVARESSYLGQRHVRLFRIQVVTDSAQDDNIHTR